MRRLTVLALCGMVALSACASSEPQVGPDGRPLPQVYKIGRKEEAQIPFRLLDAVNTLRAARGVSAMQLNPALSAAAAAHSRDMSVQNRPWHFGSDGSSPVVRVQRAGYSGALQGELISETYETELETLSAWMGQADTRDVLLDANANELGFSWFQEGSGKIWWTLVTGNANGSIGMIVSNTALGAEISTEMDGIPQ